nr:MAG TPA: hypothetical protein [Bacteriophage sp.]
MPGEASYTIGHPGMRSIVLTSPYVDMGELNPKLRILKNI